MRDIPYVGYGNFVITAQPVLAALNVLGNLQYQGHCDFGYSLI